MFCRLEWSVSECSEKRAISSSLISDCCEDGEQKIFRLFKIKIITIEISRFANFYLLNFPVNISIIIIIFTSIAND